MRPTFAVFVGTSLDGFIARVDGSIEWLNEANKRVPPGEDCGYAEFMRSVDALLIGRKTFETALSFGDWPYADKPVYVLSHTLETFAASVPRTTSLLRGSVQEIAAHIERRGHRKVYLDGGQTVRAFLAADMVDELTITQVPVLIGSGRSLFGPVPHDIHLKHMATRAYPFGFVQSRYVLQRAA
jgi:dihydrofolate reductase